MHSRRVLVCNEASRRPSLEGNTRGSAAEVLFAVSESDELSNYSNQVTQAQRSIHTDISRNRRQYSEIRDSESRKNIGLRKVGEAVAEREESHRSLIRIVQSTSLKPEDLQRGCPLNNLSLDAVFRERTAFEFPCLSPDWWRFMLMRFTKRRKNETERELLAIL